MIVIIQPRHERTRGIYIQRFIHACKYAHIRACMNTRANVCTSATYGAINSLDSVKDSVRVPAQDDVVDSVKDCAKDFLKDSLRIS